MKTLTLSIVLCFVVGTTGCHRQSTTSSNDPEPVAAGSQGTPVVAAPPNKEKKDRKPKFTIGKETTYVTGPVDQDGYIDYAAALNERLSKGVTPETNANVLIWKALGPIRDGKQVPAEFFKLMGMDEPPANGEYFVELRAFLREQLKIEDDGSVNAIDRQVSTTTGHPWTAEEHPEIAAWLKANQKPLDLIVEGTKRPGYFSPLVPEKTDSGAMMTAILSNSGDTRRIASAFASRAMLKLNDRKVDECWSDLLACHRFARMIGRQGTFVEGLLANAVEAIVQRAELTFLERAEVDSKRIQACFDDVKNLRPLSKAADRIDLGERLFFLQNALATSREAIRSFDNLSDEERKKVEDPEFIEADWDPALRLANKWFDRFAATMREADRTMRTKQFDDMKRELKQAVDAPDPRKTTQTEAVCNVSLSLQFDTIRRMQDAADRVEQSERNLHIAFALATYQRDHQSYPKALDDLVPKYLPKLPDDLFTGKPLIYRPSENGYLLYSLGPNGKDDDGRGPGDKPAGGDDITVRMPVPKPVKK